MLFPCIRHIIFYLVLFQHRKRSDMTETFLTGMKSINSNNLGLLLLSTSVLDL